LDKLHSEKQAFFVGYTDHSMLYSRIEMMKCAVLDKTVNYGLKIVNAVIQNYTDLCSSRFFGDFEKCDATVMADEFRKIAVLVVEKHTEMESLFSDDPIIKHRSDSNIGWHQAEGLYSAQDVKEYAKLLGDIAKIYLENLETIF
jgi:hypothetical protein